MAIPAPSPLPPHDPRQLSLATSPPPTLLLLTWQRCDPRLWCNNLDCVTSPWSRIMSDTVAASYIHLLYDHVSAEQANPRYGIGRTDRGGSSIANLVSNRGGQPRFPSAFIIAPGLLIMPWHFSSPVCPGYRRPGAQHGSGEQQHHHPIVFFSPLEDSIASLSRFESDSNRFRSHFGSENRWEELGGKLLWWNYLSILDCIF